MNPRRLVTGHDSDGKAIVVSDEVVTPVTLACSYSSGTR